MRDFKTDQVQSLDQMNERRASQVEQIKKVIPDFDDVGKTDSYIKGFYKGIASSGASKKEEEVAENKAKDTAAGIKDAQENFQDISDMQNQRLNMKGASANE